MASTQGVLFPIIFFYINPSIRKKWQQLIAKQCCRFCLLEDDPDKLPRQSESNEIEETVEPGESTSNNTDSMFVLEDSFNVLFFQSSNSSNTIITNSSVEMPSFSASPSSSPHRKELLVSGGRDEYSGGKGTRGGDEEGRIAGEVWRS